jgi:uncharacterized protein (DUF302 family)
MKYYINKKINSEYENAIEKVTEALKTEGFGVITKIDIKNTFKEKLDINFREYAILGACNPSFAYKALQKEDKIGLLLPCNVIVQDLGNNEIEIAAIDPVVSMMAVEQQDIVGIAGEIKEMLIRVIASL